MRQLGIDAFSKVLKNPKNCNFFEKYVYEQCKKDCKKDFDEKTYIWCIYQVIGLFLQNNDSRKIATDIKAGKIGWKSPSYEEISRKMEEFDNYLIKPFEIAEGVSECGVCHSKKTWSVQKQIRSQDEPMTTFSRCVECGHQWSYSG